jgi:hypothetical protein
MADKSPRYETPTPDPGPKGESAPKEQEAESPVAQEDELPPDQYDDLWDPDMDTRPERIKRTKVRSKVDSRSRGRPTPRRRPREET